MKVGDLVIKWLYSKEGKYIEKEDMTVEVERTDCVIQHAETEKVLGQSATWCSPYDVYNKEKGRRIALQRALLSGPLNKATRSEVWEAYRTLTKVPRWEVKKNKPTLVKSN